MSKAIPADGQVRTFSQREKDAFHQRPPTIAQKIHANTQKEKNIDTTNSRNDLNEMFITFFSEKSIKQKSKKISKTLLVYCGGA